MDMINFSCPSLSLGLSAFRAKFMAPAVSVFMVIVKSSHIYAWIMSLTHTAFIGRVNIIVFTR